MPPSTLDTVLSACPDHALGRLRSLNLAAYAYTALPAADSLRPALRADYLAALARHHRITADLAPLLRLWAAEGMQPLLFKGFALAEFVYPVPGARYHGDADVCFRADQAERAGRLALEAGWHSALPESRSIPRYRHDAFVLRRAGGDTQLDGHRFVIHRSNPWGRHAARFTAAVAAASDRVEWQGVTVRVPHPVDSALILVLQRAWGEQWALKPHDAIDLSMLEQAGATPERLRARARELGCERTLRVFLDTMSRGGATSTVQSLACHVRALPERPGAILERPLVRAWSIPGGLACMVPVLPDVLRVRRLLTRGDRKLRALLAATEPSSPRRRASARRMQRAVRGVRIACRLLPLNGDGDCLLRSLAGYRVLRRLGFPARLVSGVRRELAQGPVEGHAWVELDGAEVIGWGDGRSRERFTVTFEHPQADAAGGAR